MHIRGKCGLTLLVVGLSATALAAPDSGRRVIGPELPVPDMKLKVPDAASAPQSPPVTRGRWTLEGWSNEEAEPNGASPQAAGATPPPEARPGSAYGADTGAVGTQIYRNGPGGETTVIVRTPPQVTTTVVEETIIGPATARSGPATRVWRRTP